MVVGKHQGEISEAFGPDAEMIVRAVMCVVVVWVVIIAISIGGL